MSAKVTFDAISYDSNSGAGDPGPTVEWNHIVAAGASGLLLMFHEDDDLTPTGATFDGVAMTYLGGASSPPDTRVYHYFWLEHPHVGTLQIAVTMPSTGTWQANAISVFGSTGNPTGQGVLKVATSHHFEIDLTTKDARSLGLLWAHPVGFVDWGGVILGDGMVQIGSYGVFRSFSRAAIDPSYGGSLPMIFDWVTGSSTIFLIDISVNASDEGQPMALTPVMLH